MAQQPLKGGNTPLGGGSNLPRGGSNLLGIDNGTSKEVEGEKLQQVELDPWQKTTKRAHLDKYI